LLGVFQEHQHARPKHLDQLVAMPLLAKCYKLQGRDADAAIYAADQEVVQIWVPREALLDADADLM